MQVEPYLNFDGRCEEALDFYKNAVGATIKMLMRFKESPDQSMITPGSENKVMHAAVQLGDSLVLMSDGRCTPRPISTASRSRFQPRRRPKPTRFSTVWPMAAKCRCR